MLQDILGGPEWARLLTPADRRGLTPLFWSHVRPYGEVNLDMGARLALAAVAVPGPRAPADVDEHRQHGLRSENRTGSERQASGTTTVRSEGVVHAPTTR